MSRSIEYRRHHNTRIFKKRLKRMSITFIRINDVKIFNPKWFILDNIFKVYKNVTTTNWDSKYKDKWGFQYGFSSTNKSRRFIKKETSKIIEDELYKGI